MYIFPRIIAGILLILLSPLFLTISVLSVIMQGNPVFFKQSRVGYHFKQFTLYKFRTMINNASGNLITRSGDNRVTMLGKILRSTKIDELPQLFNIIRGDIYFVGPRPEVVPIVQQYPDYFRFLNLIKPGVTDISSIILKNESFLLTRQISYESDLLPIKKKLVEVFIQNNYGLNRLFIILLTVLSIFIHNTALSIISKYFIPEDDKDLRARLCQLLSTNIF